MTDNRPGDGERPDLNTTEMRQGNSRRMNLRVLTIGIIVVIIGFALAIWYNTTVTPDTATTQPAGETLDTAPPADDATATDMEDGAMPVPTDDAVVEPAPTEEPATEAPAVADEPAPVVEDDAVVEDEPVAQ